MRIAILSLHIFVNYGGILQAYALQNVLKRLGHQPVHLDYSGFHIPYWKLPLSYLKRISFKLFKNRNTIISAKKEYIQQSRVISTYTRPFIEKHLNIHYLNKLSELNTKDFDACIVGSDQVWRPEYFGFGKIENAFLSFLGNQPIKRIAYAASFGVSNWTYTTRQTRNCCSLLKKFSSVSVREDSAINLCKQYLHRDVEQTLDPTLLLEKNDYLSLIESKQASKGNLLVYFLDETENKKQITNKVAKEKRLIPFRSNAPTECKHLPIEKRIQPPVESWLQGFEDAQFVITDSFHACVFSILFNKPFFVIGNESRGLTRITSLLKQFGLENRLIQDASTIIFPNENIDWEIVNNRLVNLRKTSYDFLKKSLE